MILDIAGRAVETLRATSLMKRREQTETLHATSLQNGTATINVSHLPSGIYFLRIGDKTVRFVKE